MKIHGGDIVTCNNARKKFFFLSFLISRKVMKLFQSSVFAVLISNANDIHFVIHLVYCNVKVIQKLIKRIIRLD